ncbi:hypothetical protein BC827DRAFT_1247422 [Russula dissimulans]|nr:hypothetical protein BC827DRAFT_1247422 [Russula dissimulans]
MQDRRDQMQMCARSGKSVRHRTGTGQDGGAREGANTQRERIGRGTGRHLGECFFAIGLKVRESALLGREAAGGSWKMQLMANGWMVARATRRTAGASGRTKGVLPCAVCGMCRRPCGLAAVHTVP